MNIIHQYVGAAKSFIWGKQAGPVPRRRNILIQFLRIGHLVIRDLLEGMLTLQAMSLVYTTLLSIVPLVAVSFSVLKGFGVHNLIEPALLNVLQPLGEKGIEVTHRIIEFVDNTRAGVLGSLGLALLFYTVVSLIQKIERSFNYTWRITEHRPFVQRFSDYLSVILLGPLLIFTALGITASITGSSVMQQLMEYQVIGWLISTISRLVPYLLVIAAFTVVYLFVPNTRVQTRAAFAGAVVAGFLWQTTGWAFASFVVNSTKYTAIYSAFATLIIFMIWLYLCWLILLTGASIAFYVQHPEYRTLQARNFRLSNRMKEKISLLAMAIVSENHYAGKDPMNTQDISKQLKITGELLKPVIDALVEKRLLVRIGDEDTVSGLLPARPAENMKVRDILDTIRRAEEHDNTTLDILPRHDAVDRLFESTEDAAHSSIGDVTLKDISLQMTRVEPAQNPAAVNIKSGS
ncbi:MAG: YihY/virulence factor BrkB family protein [Gammaproteobacteria bacterium]|jgi:membrane protein